MNKTKLIALVAALLLLPGLLSAQILTTARGTTTNSNIPVVGNYADCVQKTQIIYPADSLSAMTGDSIRELVFHAFANAIDWGTSAIWTVKLGEVADTAFASTTFLPTNGFDTVYVGNLAIQDHELYITCNTPYHYNGGNLLIEISKPSGGDYITASFYGATMSSYCSMYEYTYTSPSSNRLTFLPKVTFYYGNAIPCHHPLGVTFNIHGDTADFTWTGTASEYEYIYGPVGFNPDSTDLYPTSVFTNSASIYGLILDDRYDFYVRAVCGTDNTSSWFGPIAFRMFNYYNLHSGSDTLHTCSITLFDNGGENGSYSSNSDDILVVYPQSDDKAFVIEGWSRTESGYDYLRIYSGVGTTGTLLYDDFNTGSRTNIGPIITEGGPITISFHSDVSTQYEGFEVTLSCVDLPNCFRPYNLTVSDITDQSITLNWQDSLNYEWNIEYDTAGFTRGNGLSVSAYDTTYTIYGLNPNSYYDFYLNSVCGGDSSFTLHIQARTACAPIPNDSLPYFYGFEDALISGHTINPCWTKGSNYSTYPNVSSTAASGNRSIYFYSSGSNYCYAALPAFDENVANLQISFKIRQYYSGNYDYTLLVGVMTDPSDINTFTPVETFHATSTTTWDSLTCYLSSYEGEGRYIAFRTHLGSSSQYTYVLLDDIVVDYAPDCAPVTGLQAVPSTTSVAVSWTPNANNTSVNTEVMYREHGSTDDWISAYFSGTSAVLTGLQPATTYDLHVMSICSEGPSAPATTTFTTNQFDCLQYDPATLSIDTIAGGTASNNYYPAYGWEYSLTQQIYLASELTGVQSISKIQFETATASTSPTRSLDIYLGHTPDTTLSDSASLVCNDLTLVYSGDFTYLANGWVTVDLDSPFTYNDSANLLMVIHDHTNHFTSGNAGMVHTLPTGRQTRYFYNMSTPYNPSSPSGGGTLTNYRSNVIFSHQDCIQRSTCAAPSLVVSNISVNEATLTIAPGSTETAWDIYYKTATETSWTSAGTATYTEYLLSGLYGGMRYTVRVDNICSGDTLSSTVEFTTPCTIIDTLPFAEDFNSWGTGSNVLPNCWNGNSYITSSYNHSSATGGAIYMYAYSDPGSYTLALPVFDSSINLSDLGLRFHMYQIYNASYYHSGAVEVGVLTSLNDFTSFIPLDTLECNAAQTWEEKEFYFSNYADSAKQIGFRCLGAGSSNYIALDDLTVFVAPSCLRPIELQVSDITATSASVQWNNHGIGQTEVTYGITGSTATTTVIVAADSITLTGLTIGAEYTVIIRADCGGDYSDSNSITFHTLNSLPVTTLPYACDFSGAAGNEWNLVNGTQSNIWNLGTAAHDASTTDTALYISNNGGTDNQYTNSSATAAFAYRQIVLPAGDYIFQFDWRCLGEHNYDFIRVALLPDDAPLTAGVTNGWSYSSIPNGGIALDGGEQLQGQSAWTSSSNEFTVDTANTYKIVLYWRNDGSAGSNPPAAIDNILLSVNTCPRVTDVVSTSATTTTASIDWTVSGTESQWQIEYGPTGFALGTGTLANATSHPFVINGLTANTTYDIYVRPVCSATDTGLYTAGRFVTPLCDNPVITEIIDTTLPVSTSTYMPIVTGYEASVTQMILDSTQLAGTTNIEALQFYYTGIEPLTHITDAQIYIQPTTLQQFADNDAYLPFDSTAVLVYQGPFNAEAGWNTYLLDTTYTYSGSGNLALIVYQQAQDYTSGATFRTRTQPDYKTHYAYSYDTIDLYDLGNADYSYRSNYLPEMRLIACTPQCAAPEITSVTHDYHSATLSWTGDGTDYEVNIKEASAPTWPSANTAVTGNTYTFTGLLPATAYTLRLRQNCTADSLDYSEWVEHSFITDSLVCITPSALATTEVTNATATFTWTAGGDEHQWDIHVWNTIFDSTYRIAAQPATIGGFTAGITYNATIRALCGTELYEGDWSDTIQFTTATCPDVTGLTTANVTYNSVTLNWDDNTEAQSWMIEYGPSGFTQGQGIQGTSNTASFVATGLTDGMTYDFHVKAVCGTDWFSDNWASVTATTQPAPEGIDHVDGVSCTIFPNPATSATTVSVTGANGKVRISVVDMNGRTVATETLECSDDCVKTMEVDHLAQGAYFVRITGDNINMVKKLIVR